MYELESSYVMATEIEFFEEVIMVREHSEFIDSILDKMRDFEFEHSMSPDCLYVNVDDYRKLISAMSYRSGDTFIPVKFCSLDIVVVPSLSSPDVGVKDQRTMLSIDYFNKNS